MNIETANRLIELRKRKGLSQEELAAELGISRQAVSKWERAEAGPDVDNAILLSRLYGVTLDELFGNKPDYERTIEQMRCEEEPEPEAEPAPEPEPEEEEEPAEGETHSAVRGTEYIEGVTRLILRVRADVTLTAVKGGVLALTAEGPDDELNACRVTTCGHVLKIETPERRRGFFGFFGSHRLRLNIAVPASVKNVEAALRGGDAKLEGLDLNKLELTTGGGDISVSETLASRLRIKTGGGDVELKGVKAYDSSCVTGGGDIIARRLEVTADSSFATGGGDIEADGAARSFSFRTGGGNMRLDLDSRDVETKTGGGDLKLAVRAPERVSCRTGGGDIRAKLTQVCGIVCDMASVGGRSLVRQNGEELASGRSVTVTVGDGSSCFDAKSGGGDIVLELE